MVGAMDGCLECNKSTRLVLIASCKIFENMCDIYGSVKPGKIQKS